MAANSSWVASPWARPSPGRRTGAPGRRAPRRRSRAGRRGRSRGRSGAPGRSRWPRRSRRPSPASPSPDRRALALRAARRPWRARRSRRRRSARWSTRSPRPSRVVVPTGCSASSIPSGSSIRSTPSASSTLQAPLASTRIRASGPTASRTARTWATSSSPPSLSLKVAKPRAAQRSASAATSAGGPETRVALQATGAASAAPSSDHSGLPGRLAGEVEERHLDRRPRRRRDPAPGDRVDERVDRCQGGVGPGEVGQLRAAQAPRSLADPALDRRQVGAAAQRQRHRLAEPDEALVGEQAHEHHLAPLEPAARGHVGALERERVGDDLDLDQLQLSRRSAARPRPGR